MVAAARDYSSAAAACFLPIAARVWKGFGSVREQLMTLCLFGTNGLRADSNKCYTVENDSLGPLWWMAQDPCGCAEYLFFSNVTITYSTNQFV
jgi:hypothetical protein